MALLKKIVLFCLLTAVCLACSSAAPANAALPCPHPNGCGCDYQGDFMHTNALLSYSGTVTEIIQNQQLNRICFNNQNGNPESFNITSNTFMPEQLAVGDKIVGFTYAWRPELMIYPPQHFADVIVKQPQNSSVFAGVFDSNLTSTDNKLKLNIATTTLIVDKDGNAIEQIPANSLLVVYYTITTRSIPAQTTPQKVIVVGEGKTQFS